MAKPTPDDDEFLSDILSLGAAVNAARDEGLPPPVREMFNGVAAEQASEISRKYGTDKGTE
ncbi:hypothetical protein ACFVT2_34900 [Streptomyces sp. NPDC058000]|uniref:hypothetical protein n=1 Tax=Streptomyces sp. NPDC058000 TaxID=3346299 RepID=UPI0036E961AD